MSDETAPTTDTVGHAERVLDAGALKALGHPIRVRIFDYLTQFGPQTASSLAARLGESSGSTSYHLRALARHNLVAEVRDRGSARERWWERPQGAVMIGAPEVTATPSGRAATQLVSAEIYRLAHEKLMRFIESDPGRFAADTDTTLDDVARLQLSTLKLTRDQFREMSAEIGEIIDRASARSRTQADPDVRPYLLRVDFFPLEASEHTGGDH